MDTGQSSVKKIGFSPIMEAPQYKTNSTNSQEKSKNLNDEDPEACIPLETFDSMNLKTKLSMANCHTFSLCSTHKKF